MSRYLFLHRIKGPVMIMIFGLTALLKQWGILSYSESWPLYLIALGILQLAERAAWSQAQIPPTPYPGAYTGQPGGWTGPTGPGSGAGPSSTAMTITPPNLPRDGEIR